METPHTVQSPQESIPQPAMEQPPPPLISASAHSIYYHQGSINNPITTGRGTLRPHEAHRVCHGGERGGYTHAAYGLPGLLFQTFII